MLFKVLLTVGRKGCESQVYLDASLFSACVMCFCSPAVCLKKIIFLLYFILVLLCKHCYNAPAVFAFSPK